MGYQPEGKILEGCDCNILCPCCVGEDPCDAVLAYHIDRGRSMESMEKNASWGRLTAPLGVLLLTGSCGSLVIGIRA